MDAAEKLSRILNVPEATLKLVESSMSRATGKRGVFEDLIEKNGKAIDATLLGMKEKRDGAYTMLRALREAIFWDERELSKLIERESGKDKFEKAASLARKMARVSRGFFLKQEHIKEVFLKRPPENLLRYLGYDSVESLIAKENLTESFSALRFTESNEWMHETFEDVYSSYTPDDFEEREIEVRVLGPQWEEISKKFIAKKHHNVSHLKEFGVIFLNPIEEDLPGKFLRDFALLLHYFHEVQFYSKLFKQYFKREDFADRFKSLLRGDVKESGAIDPAKGEWLIVQRYLMKENPNDPRLFLPRVNPESMHWARGERDMVHFTEKEYDLRLWGDRDWVGDFFHVDGKEALVSFDIEDNAMSLVAFMEGKEEIFNYHQREALWTKLFSEYAGGEAQMEELLLGHFEEGVVRFNK